MEVGEFVGIKREEGRVKGDVGRGGGGFKIVVELVLIKRLVRAPFEKEAGVLE
jgi:hypothetical protein